MCVRTGNVKLLSIYNKQNMIIQIKMKLIVTLMSVIFFLKYALALESVYDNDELTFGLSNGQKTVNITN